ncbi:hypothetical protein BLNAU_19850 [Blattamonas nauphoetae]|uniref:Uncharacterized protein n=1 Tax=Blattamonas nauphoetae TaxID=2049346 RepID=A0ABQ9X0I0_9EUKA|nr:hypothetical protein BLNAU_19850 [Blattamonas nauphoetae]
MEDTSHRHSQTISNQKEELDRLNHANVTLQRQLKEDEERLTNEKKEEVGEIEAMLTKEREKRKDAEATVERAREQEQATEITIREAEARIQQLLIEKENAENNLKESKEREKRAEEREMKAHADRREAELTRQKMEEEKKKAETERAKMEEEKKKAETERAKMEEEKTKAETERTKMEEENQKAEEMLKTIEEQKGQVEREKEKLSDEVKRTLQELGEARSEKEKNEREKSEMSEKMKQMRVMMGPEWAGTESLKTLGIHSVCMSRFGIFCNSHICKMKKGHQYLPSRGDESVVSVPGKLSIIWIPLTYIPNPCQTLDRTAHKLTPTTLTQIIKLEKDNEWRTAFTVPIDEGEWELKIKTIERPFLDVMLGFLKYPLPENATQSHCGTYSGRIGGDFILINGGMWQRGEFKPAGTNKKCDRVGQTAAIRVNMSTREARLFVDDEEQPGIFTKIPSPLCLGITTQDQNAHIEIFHLATTDILMTEPGQQTFSKSARIKTLEKEKLKMEEKMERMRKMLRTEWIGTESLKTFDRTVHMSSIEGECGTTLAKTPLLLLFLHAD